MVGTYMKGRNGPIYIFVIFTTATKARNKIIANSIKICILFISISSVINLVSAFSKLIELWKFMEEGINNNEVKKKVLIIFSIFIY